MFFLKKLEERLTMLNRNLENILKTYTPKLNLEKWELQCVRGKVLDGIHDSLEIVEEKISECNHMEIKIIQNEKEKWTEHHWAVAQFQAA